MDNSLPPCPICFQEFNDQTREPRILNCGHTVCLSCLTQILLDGARKCPLCNQRLESTSKDNFKKNYILMHKCNQERPEFFCKEHGYPKALICYSCKDRCCQKCMLKGPHKSHDMDTLDDFREEVRSKRDDIDYLEGKAKNKETCISGMIDKIRKYFISSITKHFQSLIEAINQEK